ncbi:TonB-dependent receptor [Methylophaga thiooxydans]|uniref:TonB-dependent receptor n=1 Tax=Methylophaga thiooxydans TaxID=392484 RepID=UPI002352296A|nr:TonB-dependent receptor [Methylophaga thiooxydans]
MTVGKWTYLSVCTALVFAMSGSIVAAPTLKMHVFDAQPSSGNENDVAEIKTVTNTYQLAESVNNKAKEPETLKLHVYDRTPEKRTPPLSYDYADVYLKTGYRRDELQWNKAGLGGQPNILSELTWDDIEIATINLGATFYLKNNWFLNGDIVWGEIFDGKNQDSDYLGNNRTMEFSRSNNGADEGNILDISVAFGHRFEWPLNQANTSRFELRPKLGLSYHSQNLKAVDGYQTIPANGAFAGLDSSYDTTWFGPWAGLETIFIKHNKFELGLNLEYHYIDYDAEAEWNLRSDFAQPVSFEHEADGSGWVAGINSKWYFSPDLAMTFDFEYQKWLADRNGVDKIYFSDGSEARLKFNEADWESYGFSLGLNYDF